mmetsp:Transcript_18442/g.25377  ORF Transcript_18442/g.25377 Transcript_18442/m.25377 type:complete len:97 (+) Transcript_18442:775-1065(+)
MFSANNKAAKWLMNSKPELQDSQNDTPVSIALKECAYFLLAYDQQNEGQLDDGTSYTDEKHGVYYSEARHLPSVFTLNCPLTTKQLLRHNMVGIQN